MFPFVSGESRYVSPLLGASKGDDTTWSYGPVDLNGIDLYPYTKNDSS